MQKQDIINLETALMELSSATKNITAFVFFLLSKYFTLLTRFWQKTAIPHVPPTPAWSELKCLSLSVYMTKLLTLLRSTSHNVSLFFFFCYFQQFFFQTRVVNLGLLLVHIPCREIKKLRGTHLFAQLIINIHRLGYVSHAPNILWFWRRNLKKCVIFSHTCKHTQIVPFLTKSVDVSAFRWRHRACGAVILAFIFQPPLSS